MFMGKKFGQDSIWETHLAEEMWFTDVELEAVLDEMTMPLDRVLDLHVGSRIMLNATPHSRVTLTCGDVLMYLGRIGRKGASIAIRIKEQVKSRKASP